MKTGIANFGKKLAIHLLLRMADEAKVLYHRFDTRYETTPGILRNPVFHVHNTGLAAGLSLTMST
jgi:hypothetical protein